MFRPKFEFSHCWALLYNVLGARYEATTAATRIQLHHDNDILRSIVPNQLAIDGVAEPNNQAGVAIVDFNPFKDGEKKYSPPRGMMNVGIPSIVCSLRGSSPDIARLP
jgi:hypothetical protein